MIKIYRSVLKAIVFFFLLTGILVLLQNKSKAQANAYSFSTVTGTAYTELPGGTVVASATAATSPGNLDEIVYNLPAGTIPFSFVFNSIAYTGMNISSNGFITFGATAPFVTTYTPASSSAAFAGAVAFCGANLSSYFYTSPASQNGEIRYQTLGVSPNRIFVVQWKNFKPQSFSNTFGNSINGQIRLNEGTNVIEVAYKITGVFSGLGGQAGLRGASNSDFTVRKVLAGGNWAASTNVSNVNTDICSYSTTFPVSGLIYKYSPPCFALTGVTTNNIKFTQADANWTSGNPGASVKLEYGPTGFVQGGPNGTVVNNAVSPYTMTGFTANTTYQYYLTQTCNTGLTSVTGPITFTTARLGENFATALPITVSLFGQPVTETLVTSGVSKDGPNAVCTDGAGNTGADDDFWYKFVAPAGINKIAIGTRAGTLNDWIMEVWEVDPDSPGTAAKKCNDDSSTTSPVNPMPFISLCQNEYVAGNTYYIRVWSYATAQSGNMYLRAYQTYPCAPVNDACIDAITLPIGIPLSCPLGKNTFSTYNATASAGTTNATCPQPNGSNSSINGPFNDMFFRFNTASFKEIALTLKPLNGDSIFAQIIFDCNAGAAEVMCFNPPPAVGGTTYTIPATLNPSADYILRVWSKSNTYAGLFEVCLSDICDDSKVSLTGATSFCAPLTNDSIALTATFTGLPPWTFVYSNGTTNSAPITTSVTPFVFYVKPVATTTYSIVSINSPYCAGTVIGSSVLLTAIAPPVVTLAPFSGLHCANQSFSLSGGAPAGGSFSGAGVTGSSFNATLQGPGTWPVTYSYGIGIGCKRSATQNFIVSPTPTISSFTPTISPIGSVITINGNYFTGTSLVKINNVSSSFSFVDNNTLTATVPSTTSGFIFVQLSNTCSATSTSVFGVGTPPPFAILNVKAFLQGLYASNRIMNPGVDAGHQFLADTIRVSLNRATSPYDELASSKGPLSTSGIANLMFPGSFAGYNVLYYVVVHHRNSIETWSATPVLLNYSGTSVDFTVPRTLFRQPSPIQTSPSGNGEFNPFFEPSTD